MHSANYLQCAQVSKWEEFVCELVFAHQSDNAEGIWDDDFTAVKFQNFVDWVLNGKVPFERDTDRLHENMDFDQVLRDLADGAICRLNRQLGEQPVVPVVGRENLAVCNKECQQYNQFYY